MIRSFLSRSANSSAGWSNTVTWTLAVWPILCDPLLTDPVDPSQSAFGRPLVPVRCVPLPCGLSPITIERCAGMALGLPKRIVSRCRCIHRNSMALIERL